MKKLDLETMVWMSLQGLPDRVEDIEIRSASIEPGAVCNLRCPFCATGNGTLGLSKEFLRLADFKAMLDALGPRLRRLTLCNWGESLLNPGIYDMLAEASSRSVSTIIHANFSLPPSNFSAAHAERLVRSGLGLLYVSCDGASRETYRIYRVGGDFKRVIANVRTLLEAKRRLSSAHPDIVWLFHVHKRNRKDMPRARALAAELGIRVKFEALRFPKAVKEEWGVAQKIDAYLPGQLCMTAWKSPIIHSDGAVLPCCVIRDPRYSLGNIHREDIREIWNKPLIVAMRRYLRTGLEPDMELPCGDCAHDPHAAG